jgi:hypothetical protein
MLAINENHPAGQVHQVRRRLDGVNGARVWLKKLEGAEGSFIESVHTFFLNSDSI